MKKTKDNLLLILSFICGSGLTYFAKIFQHAEPIYFFACVVVIVALLYIVIRQKVKELKMTRFAVIVFMLNKDNKLLLTLNGTHKIWLPPCKTMLSNEMPHQTVERIMKNQVGLESTQYEIDERFHEKKEIAFYRVLDCITPYASQQEFITTQSKGVRYHYSLIYVYKIKEGVYVNRNTEYVPQFFSLENISEMEEKVRPFQDIIQRYKLILDELNGGYLK